MTRPLHPAPGFYPDPLGGMNLRYWDGVEWVNSFAPLPSAPQPTAHVQGPNHVLHAILTVLTFWFFGGWGWVWLIIALSNKKHVRYY